VTPGLIAQLKARIMMKAINVLCVLYVQQLPLSVLTLMPVIWCNKRRCPVTAFLIKQPNSDDANSISMALHEMRSPARLW